MARLTPIIPAAGPQVKPAATDSRLPLQRQTSGLVLSHRTWRTVSLLDRLCLTKLSMIRSRSFQHSDATRGAFLFR